MAPRQSCGFGRCPRASVRLRVVTCSGVAAHRRKRTDAFWASLAFHQCLCARHRDSIPGAKSDTYLKSPQSQRLIGQTYGPSAFSRTIQRLRTRSPFRAPGSETDARGQVEKPKDPRHVTLRAGLGKRQWSISSAHNTPRLQMMNPARIITFICLVVAPRFSRKARADQT